MNTIITLNVRASAGDRLSGAGAMLRGGGPRNNLELMPSGKLTPKNMLPRILKDLQRRALRQAPNPISGVLV
jgi:hypothetical protein